MTQYMIGKVLQGRYQVVQSLGAGVFGQTYVAIDIETPENPKCVIKQLKANNSEPSYAETLRLRFLTETETLRFLGQHEQIPQLISHFEENERFYLVQEFIEGHSLAAELPTNQDPECLWSESEVVDFLREALTILQFVHSQEVIHCDVKPENFIRRACDSKLVLMDFGSIQPVDFALDSVLPIYRIPVTSLGYIPPEQFIGQTQPNSDIFALGMIAIQALTGRTPRQLNKVDPTTNEIIWRLNDVFVSDYLAAILCQMIRYDFKDRYQSVTEILQALEQIPLECGKSQILEVEYTLLQKGENDHYQDELIVPSNHHPSSNISPLLVGMKVGLAVNSFMLGFGVYSLMNHSPAHQETEALYKATEEYQAGDLSGALALVKSIPSTSHMYPEAQATIEEWQNQWQIAAHQYQVAEKAFHENRWSDVLHAAPQVPDILYWQSKTDTLVEQAQDHIETRTQDLLAKASEKAKVHEFNEALDYLHQIPKDTSADHRVQQKLAEYNQKQHIRATHLLQKAYDQAAVSDFDGAIKFLHQIPKDASVYRTAKNKLIEYAQKQQIQNEGQKIASLRMTAALDRVEPFIGNSSTKTSQSSEPGSLLQEANIR